MYHFCKFWPVLCINFALMLNILVYQLMCRSVPCSQLLSEYISANMLVICVAGWPASVHLPGYWSCLPLLDTCSELAVLHVPSLSCVCLEAISVCVCMLYFFDNENVVCY